MDDFNILLLLSLFWHVRIREPQAGTFQPLEDCCFAAQDLSGHLWTAEQMQNNEQQGNIMSEMATGGFDLFH